MSSLLQIRVPDDVAEKVKELADAERRSVAQWVRNLIEDRLLKEATAPLVPEFDIAERMSVGNVARITKDENGNLAEVEIWTKRKAEVPDEAVRGVWKGTAAEWAAFQEGAGFETPEETAILDRMHGITVEEIGEILVEETHKVLQEIKAEPMPKARRKNVKGSPAVQGLGDGKDRTSDPVPESPPSPKPRKPKGCQHANTIRKLGMPFCEDCGEFV